tara:strand:- start:10145 stop:10462 length:318 start_codon:yes stop_codon:yes gene_type:complete
MTDEENATMQALQREWTTLHMEDRAAVYAFNHRASRHGFYEMTKEKPCALYHNKKLMNADNRKKSEYANSFKKLTESLRWPTQNILRIYNINATMMREHMKRNNK